MNGLQRKKRRILYQSPSYVSRLLALPFFCWMATQSPRLYITIGHTNSSRNLLLRIYISTGIYRCLILDRRLKFCENSETSRMSRDKRTFSKCLQTLLAYPNPGSAYVVCSAKLRKYLLMSSYQHYLYLYKFRA